MSEDVYKDVGEFHQKFGLPAFETRPRDWDDELVDYRYKFLKEELDEFAEGVLDKDHAKMLDALIDLVYVAAGTAHLLGYPWYTGWDRVQTANMAKIRAAKDGSDSKRGSSWDVVKPEGWTPPNIEEVLRIYGFKKCAYCHKYVTLRRTVVVVHNTTFCSDLCAAAWY
jgi:predicted HAD superfamily Cof-like phosphohydrolase